MAEVSIHGMGFAVLQFLIVLLTWYIHGRWRRHVVDDLGERPSWRIPLTLGVVLLLEFAFLRVQPHLMGGASFVYSLGVFDGVTVVGLAGLLVLHRRPTVDADAVPSSQ